MRTKVLHPTKAVRDKVLERDSIDGCPVCCVCGIPQTEYNRLDLAHFISKSHSGLAIEENLVTLCRADHELFDHGNPHEREDMKSRIREYLQSKYPGWNESQLRYKREI